MFKKGVIMKLDKSHAIVLNELMDYEKIKRVEGMFEGQMIEYQASNNGNIYKKLKLLSGAAAVLMILAVGLFIRFTGSTNSQIFAYIGLDINPSVEFSIDKSNKVINSRALNNDGENVIKPLSLKGKPIYEAIREVILESKKEKMIRDESVILISSSVQTEDKALKELKDTLGKTINHIREDLNKDNNLNLSVKTVSLDPDMRQDCLDNNISMGRYALYEKANRSGLKVSLQEARNAPVGELVRIIEKEAGNKPVDAKSGKHDTGLIDDTMPVITPEAKIANKDNDKPEADTNTPAFDNNEYTAREWADIKQESDTVQPTPYISVTSNTPVASSIPDIIPPAHNNAPAHTPKPTPTSTPINSADKDTPAGIDTGKSNPTGVPGQTDNNDHRGKRDFTPGPGNGRDHKGPGQTPHPKPTLEPKQPPHPRPTLEIEQPSHPRPSLGHDKPHLEPPGPDKPLPERTPNGQPGKKHNFGDV